MCFNENLVILQKDVSEGVTEAVARISMVTEGIKAYRNSVKSAEGIWI